VRLLDPAKRFRNQETSKTKGTTTAPVDKECFGSRLIDHHRKPTELTMSAQKTMTFALELTDTSC
jgi:hypothetical protein